jgi:hypothetical protein
MDFDIALNRKTHDLVLKDDGTGVFDLVLISNAEGVAQNVKMAILLWLKEYFLDTTQGVPYQTDIFVKNPNLSTIRSVLTAEIAKCDHIVAVDYVSLEPIDGTRQLNVSWGAYTDYGYVNQSTLISGG